MQISFIKVAKNVKALPIFDHVGGWDHTPSLSRRKKELNGVLLPGDMLDISDIKTTPEGLEEYWIQWRNKILQADCN